MDLFSDYFNCDSLKIEIFIATNDKQISSVFTEFGPIIIDNKKYISLYDLSLLTNRKHKSIQKSMSYNTKEIDVLDIRINDKFLKSMININISIEKVYSTISSRNKLIKLLDYDNYLKYIYKSRNMKDEDKNIITNYFGENVDVVKLYGSPEDKFGIFLKKTFDGIIDIKEQYCVDKYRLDFYIPKFKIAIEYDENHHDLFNNSILDAQRERIIKSKLGCQFIRIKIIDDYSIAINKILQIIFKTRRV